MKIMKILRAFSALTPCGAVNDVDIDLKNIREDYERELYGDSSYVLSLFEERAGFVSAEETKNAAYRLANLRLLTTLPAERMKSLERRRLTHGDEVGKHLPKALEAIIKLSLVDAEISSERYRADQMRDAGRRREALGIYDQVVTAIDMLFNGYGVTRWHWASASDEQLRDIAANLLRRAPGELAVVSRYAFREVKDA